jgi:phosphate-selective porin OprO/OprP
VPNRFLFRRARIGVTGTIADNMLYRLDVDVNNPNSPQFKDAYIGWEELPIFQTVLVGNQRRPYGMDNIHSSNYMIFVERAAIVDALQPDARRFGIQSWGVSEDLCFNWRYGAFLLPDLQNTGTVLATTDNAVLQSELAGRLANTIWYDETSGGRGYAHWAIAGSLANTDADAGAANAARFQVRPEARTASRWLDTGVIDGADTYQVLGLEGVLNLGPVQFGGEYIAASVQRDNGGDVEFDGAYVYASWFVTGEHLVWDRKLGTLARIQPYENFFLVDTCHGGLHAGWGAWELAMRLSEADFNDLDIAGGRFRAVTLGVNWYFNAYSRLMFNAIRGEILDHPSVDGQTDAFYTALSARLQVDF